MKLNKVVSTLEMPHEEWLRYRKKGIGGSDAGAICGVNKYRSAVSVFLDKTTEQTSEFVNEQEVETVDAEYSEVPSDETSGDEGVSNE